jgi:hypothetical protein
LDATVYGLVGREHVHYLMKKVYHLIKMRLSVMISVEPFP